jgi:tRNA-2-methylthio-N6-dimethylallyladenosine synthase
MNEYDSNRIFDITKKIDYFPTTKKSEADCYIINTCHIREKATEKVFHDVGRVKKEFKNKKKPILIITGCVAQAEGDLILKRDRYVDAVIGPQSYHSINKVIKDIENKKEQYEITNFETIKKFDELKLTHNNNSNVSSFLTIQEGCDKFCKFCVVPYTRGPEHSRNFHEILNEADRLISNGSKELILLGQNVNAYNNNNKFLSDIIYALEKKKDLLRVRYYTSHPKDMTKDLFEAHKDCTKLMPLLHLPVQSGSDVILKSMNRKHTIKDYFEIINTLKEKNPKIKFASDFIIAYPGERDDDFKKSCELMKRVKFINSYSFIYSPRPGTPACEMEMIDEKLAKKRLFVFQNLAEKIKLNYKKKLLNQKVKVLFENKMKDEKDKYFGRDEYQNPVIVHSKENIIRKEKRVLIKNFTQHTIYGELIDKVNHLAA